MSTAIVTGANRGIGLELCRQLKAGGWTVVGACRTPGTELRSVADEVWDDIEVGDDAVIDILRTRAEGRQFDLLINNAGVLKRQSLDDLDWDGARLQFEVNALGPLRVTSALLETLGEGAKVAIVTSRLGSVGDNTSGSHYGYRMSKAAANIAGVSLARDLEGRGIAVALLHPGFVRTGMTGGRGYIDATEAAAGLLARIDELTMETSGSFWHSNGEILPW
ncbi:MAG: SDR family oxidoreductase [Proteobacteria bacterium]|nr:SDR family oxidoreductase [Pseudomonadota bacterium]